MSTADLLGIVVTWLVMQKLLFPVRVRDEVTPWREALTNLRRRLPTP